MTNVVAMVVGLFIGSGIYYLTKHLYFSDRRFSSRVSEEVFEHRMTSLERESAELDIFMTRLEQAPSLEEEVRLIEEYEAAVVERLNANTEREREIVESYKPWYQKNRDAWKIEEEKRPMSGADYLKRSARMPPPKEV